MVSRRVFIVASASPACLTERYPYQFGSNEANVEDDVVTIEGRIDFAKYEGMQPVYTEYNVGHYARSFQISNKIDQSKISAEMKDGVVTLVLPRAEQTKQRKIQVD